jgi:hypothetical protein
LPQSLKAASGSPPGDGLGRLPKPLPLIVTRGVGLPAADSVEKVTLVIAGTVAGAALASRE